MKAERSVILLNWPEIIKMSTSVKDFSRQVFIPLCGVAKSIAMMTHYRPYIITNIRIIGPAFPDATISKCGKVRV